MRWMALIVCFLLLVSVVRVALGGEAIWFSQFLDIFKIPGIQMEEILSNIYSTMKDMLDSFDIGGDLERLWSNVDFWSFPVVLVESVSILLGVVDSVIESVFITVANVLQFPLQGLVFLLRILIWLFGIPGYSIA